jgi:hypothetical protein
MLSGFPLRSNFGLPTQLTLSTQSTNQPINLSTYQPINLSTYQPITNHTTPKKIPAPKLGNRYLNYTETALFLKPVPLFYSPELQQILFPHQKTAPDHP